MKYKDTWDLDSIFPGGTKSAELQNKIQTIEEEIRQFETSLNRWQFQKDPSAETLLSILKEQEKIGKGLGQTSAFVQMCHDSFMDDEHANVVMGQILNLASEMQKLSNTLMKNLVKIPDADWDVLLQYQ